MAALATTLLSVYLFSVGTFAYTGTATVNVQTKLNMRKSASSSSKVIKKLKKGTKIKITGKKGSWYKITYSGKTGYVAGKYVLIPTSAKSKLTTTSLSASSESLIDKVVQTTENMVGIKYVFGACSPSKGFDCSGLVKYAYAQVGITLPHSAAAQVNYGTKVSRSDLKAGDVVFFDMKGNHKNVTHVGIYVGDNYVIQAETGSVMKVKKISLSSKTWSNDYLTARRLLN